MKSSHPNPQRDGYNLEGSLTRISNHKITMIKCRQEIIAYTFRNYTRQRIRQLLSYPFNDNMSSYQENLSLCQRVLAVGFLRHTCGEIFGYTEFAFDFHWWWNYDSADPFPFSPLDFGVEANGFMYCPTACTYSSELVRGKQGVYTSG